MEELKSEISPDQAYELLVRVCQGYVTLFGLFLDKLDVVTVDEIIRDEKVCNCLALSFKISGLFDPNIEKVITESKLFIED
jgi:hypothetical protein